MSDDELPENVKRFIFDFIDSVELLDVLLLMNSDRKKVWNPASLSRELRTSAHSIQIRLAHLKKLGLAEECSPHSSDYQYNPQASERDAIVDELASLNKTKRHRILRLVFSPLKGIRVLADGFRVSKKKPEGSDNDG